MLEVLLCIGGLVLGYVAALLLSASKKRNIGKMIAIAKSEAYFAYAYRGEDE